MGKRAWGSPAQRAALEKARIASARARRGKKIQRTRRIYGHDSAKRGQGFSGLKKNTVPYARVNQHSQTGGFNAGTILPGTGKRLVFGAYVRLENRSRQSGVVNRATRGIGRAVAPKGTKRGAVRNYISKNVEIKNPAIRISTGKGSVRLGTSRGAGATVIVRRGSHKTPLTKSRSGVRKYDRRMKTIAGTKATRRQRRRVG